MMVTSTEEVPDAKWSNCPGRSVETRSAPATSAGTSPGVWNVTGGVLEAYPTLMSKAREEARIAKKRKREHSGRTLSSTYGMSPPQ